MPHHAGGGAQRLHREPRRIRIGEVGEHQHGLRMLEETVRHLLQGEADVLEADLLADRVERHVREAVVHRAQRTHQHRAVADAGVEQAHGGRTRMDVAELERDAARHHPLLRAGVDEQQILLPVVEEAEVAQRVGRARRMRDRHRAFRAHRRAQRCRALDHQRARERGLVAMARHEAADAVERLGGDAPAVAQAACELAVVDGAAAEGRFRQAHLTAEIGDFLQDDVVHGGFLVARSLRALDEIVLPRRALVNHKRSHQVRGQKPWVLAKIRGYASVIWRPRPSRWDILGNCPLCWWAGLRPDVTIEFLCTISRPFLDQRATSCRAFPPISATCSPNTR